MNTSPPSFMGRLQNLNPFGDGGYVRLPITETNPGAPLPAPTRREEEEGWFARKSASLSCCGKHVRLSLRVSASRLHPPLFSFPSLSTRPRLWPFSFLHISKGHGELLGSLVMSLQDTVVRLVSPAQPRLPTSLPVSPYGNLEKSILELWDSCSLKPKLVIWPCITVRGRDYRRRDKRQFLRKLSHGCRRRAFSA